MISFHAIAGGLAGILALLSFVPYVYTTLRGKTRPNRATWWIWTIVAGIIAASYLFSDEPTGFTIILPITYFFGQATVAVLSLRYGVGGWTPFDRFCLTGAAFSLLLWWLSGSPLAALLVNIAVDLFGAMPTIRKSYFEPHTENLTSWLITFGSDVFNLLAIQALTLFVLAYPLYLFVTNSIITALLLLPALNRYRHQHG